MADLITRRSMKADPSSLFDAENFLLSTFDAQNRNAASTLFDSELNHTTAPCFVAIDEVGRGCVAGPVVVCATVWSTHSGQLSDVFTRWMGLLRDSKKMSAAARDSVFELAVAEGFFTFDAEWNVPPQPEIKGMLQTIGPTLADLKLPHFQMRWSGRELEDELKRSVNRRKMSVPFQLQGAYIGSADARVIDQFGIIPALGLAGSRALAQVPNRQRPAVIFFDGHRPLALDPKWLRIPQILITKGDDLLKSISASSVIAKVIRDRWMEKYSKIFDCYFFEEHRGYGTEKHRLALSEHGPSPLHRRSFLKNICPESPV